MSPTRLCHFSILVQHSSVNVQLDPWHAASKHTTIPIDHTRPSPCKHSLDGAACARKHIWLQLTTQFIDLERMKGWVDLGGWLHTEINCHLQGLNPGTSPIPVLTGLDVEQRMAVETGHSERIKKHILTPLRWKGWERFCRCRGQQRKQMSGFLTKSKEGTVRHHQSRVASIQWSHHKETRELPGESNNARNNARCRRGRPRTAWMDSINMWTCLPVEGSVRMTEDRDKWIKYVYGVANSWIDDG